MLLLFKLIVLIECCVLISVKSDELTGINIVTLEYDTTETGLPTADGSFNDSSPFNNYVDSNEYSSNKFTSDYTSSSKENVISTTSKYFLKESDGSSKESSEWINAICNKCNHQNPKINNFTIEKIGTSAILSWNPIEESIDECKYQFNVNHTSHSIIPYFRITEGNYHKLENLKICEKYDLNIEANNDCGFHDVLATSFYTDPDVINELEISFPTKDLTNISWKYPLSSYCSKFEIRIGKNGYTTELNSYQLNGNAFCTRINVWTLRQDLEPGPISSKAVPGPVKNLEAIAAYTAVKVKWDPPDDSGCVIGYKLKINEKEEVETTDTAHTFVDLYSCFDYIIKVSAISDDSIGLSTQVPVTTLTPDKVKVVRNANLHFAQSLNALIVNWDPPTLQDHCVTNYKLVVWDQFNQNRYEEDTLDTNYIFKPVVPCMKYHINIKAQIGDTTESGIEALEEQIPPLEPLPPVEKSNRVGSTFIEITYNTVKFEQDMCTLSLIKLTCEAKKEENSNHEWIVKEKSDEKTIEDDNTRPPIKVLLTGLSPFTNYTCYSILSTEGGSSEASAETKLMTDPGRPSAPILQINKIEATSFEMSWKEPEKTPGILESYELTLEPLKIHFIPEDCEWDKTPIKYTFPAKDTSYIFTNALPHFKYKIILKAKVKDVNRYGDEAQESIETKNSNPDPPRGIDYEIENLNDENGEYKVNFNFHWKYPCNPNGKISYFILSYKGVALTGIDHEDSIIIDTNEEVDYSYKISDIRAEHIYTIKLKSVIDNNLESEESKVIVKSPDGYPGKPILHDITEVDEKSFKITWDEPNNKNGEILGYRINLVQNGPIHNLPEDCQIENINRIEPVPPELREFRFENLPPNNEFSVYIQAQTEPGYGLSEMKKTRTNQWISESVRDLQHEIKQVDDGEEYKADLILSFNEPCNCNSYKCTYFIKMYCIRGTVSHNFTIQTILLKHTIPLEPAEDCDLEVTVINRVGNSDPISKSFITPSGVPLPAKKTLTPGEVKTYTASFTFDNEFFDSSNGDVKHYAIMVSPTGTFNESYGYWDGNNWPEVNAWSEDIMEEYQATTSFWNPFTNYETTFTYTVGIENCTGVDEFCNGSLRPNTNYAVKLRAYTENGFRDTDEYDFLTMDIENLLTTVQIIFICVGVLVIIIIILILIMWWWRTRHKRYTNPPIAEEAIVISIPIPLKEYPHYYNNIMENTQLLKTEFADLQLKSVECTLPITVANIIENKKKNRYTNILPYDDTRVILQNYENDYINASYIKGYSGQIEYIASQGPLEHTVVDFWNMVIDENVTIIAMVSHFIERGKEKCYKYIPDRNAVIDLEDNFQVRCSIELDFGFYYDRQIIIQKNKQTYKISHLQFKNWPDFGCPKGTENMLQYCLFLRKQFEAEGGKMVVHCSAGVGRTGTLISIDILLQTIKDEGNIDILNTVLNLRKQRKDMVQNEAQYCYIYSCIHDAIKNPPKLQEIKAIEPIYENIQTNNCEQIDIDTFELKDIQNYSDGNIESEG